MKIKNRLIAQEIINNLPLKLEKQTQFAFNSAKNLILYPDPKQKPITLLGKYRCI